MPTLCHRAFMLALCAGLATATPAAGLLDGLRAASRSVVQGVQTNVQANLNGESTVIGYVEVISPAVGYVTCFKDVPGSALSATPISTLQEASGFPAMIVTRDKVVASGQCSELIKFGLLKGMRTVEAAPPAASPPSVVAAAAPATDNGAQLCHLSAADMQMLSDLALRFVRFDRARDRIVMSEIHDGTRQDIELDDKTFALRASQTSQDLAQGGVVCGRAYWNGQAIKQAGEAITAAQ